MCPRTTADGVGVGLLRSKGVNVWDLERGRPGFRAAFADDLRCGLGQSTLFPLNEV